MAWGKFILQKCNTKAVWRMTWGGETLQARKTNQENYSVTCKQEDEHTKTYIHKC